MVRTRASPPVSNETWGQTPRLIHVLTSPRCSSRMYLCGFPLLVGGQALDTPHGRIAIEWHLVGGSLRLRLDVPDGCEAAVHLPSGAQDTVGPGRHDWTEPERHNEPGLTGLN